MSWPGCERYIAWWNFEMTIMCTRLSEECIVGPYLADGPCLSSNYYLQVLSDCGWFRGRWTVLCLLHDLYARYCFYQWMMMSS